MSHKLVNRIKSMTGFTWPEKAVLKELADVSHDDETVFLRMDRLVLYVGCSLRTAQRALRSLERRGVLIPQGEKHGRGTVHVWRFNLDPPVEVEEEPPITEELTPTNGTRSASINPPGFFESIIAEKKENQHATRKHEH